MLKKSDMRVFFTDRESVSNNTIILSGDNYHHIKNVLRLKPEAQITVKCGGGAAYTCIIREFSDSEVVCDIIDAHQNDNELPVAVHIYQGLPKGDKLETVIQKCTELGAMRIIPVITERTIIKMDEKKKKAKVRRWQKLATAACEQSRRSVLCEVGEPLSFETAVAEAASFDHFLFPYECADGFAYTKKKLSEIKCGETIAVFIGPEGGFSDRETGLAKAAGANIITLGKRILRTETAAMYVMSVLGFLFEEG